MYASQIPGRVKIGPMSGVKILTASELDNMVGGMAGGMAGGTGGVLSEKSGRGSQGDSG